MPAYEFLCNQCGPFEKLRPTTQASDPAQCPHCENAARRVYSIPATKRTPTALSKARDRAEKSAHEPEVARQPSGGRKFSPGHGGHNH